ncbi:MAG: glycoside hydrolase family 99-like domain-containing protein, partial [Armatimonadota bacterium]
DDRLGGRYADAVETADAYGRISSLTLIPGYDDTKIREPGLNVRRHDGRLYEELWKLAIECDPHWVLITSWNEWHEGSEIEPSLEYGDRYIELTARFAKRFKQTPRAPRAVEVAGLPPRRMAAVKRSLAGTAFGLLPDAMSEAPFWLMEVGADVRPLTWEQVVDPAALDAQKLPALIYACGENYVQTVRAARDVDDALVRYLRQGGLLISVAGLPYPFFRTVDGEVVVTAGKFGLPLTTGQVGAELARTEPQVQGFEAPPEGAALTFHVDTERLKGLPRDIPFPTAGDLRWRPFLGRGLPEGNTYVPLIELRDEQGRWWGDAVAYVEYKASEPKNGRVLYVWFGLLNMPIANQLLASTFEFLAGAGL